MSQTKVVVAVWLIVGCADLTQLPAAEPEWAGEGALRVFVRVPADKSAGREGDERPAEVAVDFAALLAEAGIERRPDMASLQVIQHDPATGAAIEPGKFAFARGKFDVPWRWYDAAIPYDFPEVERAVSYTDGTLEYKQRPRFGYFYHCIGDWQRGRLVFPHRQRGEQPAVYAVYFDLLDDGETPSTVPPRGFVGDGLQRCLPQGASTTGLIHSRVDAADYDGDGLLDLLVGCARGGIVVYPNRGTPQEPRYPFSKLLFTTDGKPLDVGWSAAPKWVDWTGDGLPDLLVGAEWNRVLLYVNRGKVGEPAFEYAGPLKTDDGELLVLPTTPVAEQPDVFKRDYYPVLETVDWDGNGDTDLLAGGYITGRIYFYENIAGAEQQPRLKLVGPLEADGEPLDVQWAAAPAVADFDGDGDLDLVSGCMKMTRGGGDDASSEYFLHYFRNDGTRNQPQLHAAPLPHTGAFPRSALGTPRAVDFNDDGLIDIVASGGTNVYLFENVGEKTAPKFAAHRTPLPSTWGSASLPTVQFLDFDGDGLLDGANGPQIYPNLGKGSPGLFGAAKSLLKPGQEISHLSGIGDDWRFQRLFDLDADGLIDLMDADHGGHIWWHRNHGTKQEADFETEGVRLNLVDGEPVRVGLNREGFDKLQGARATYTVGDFDGDGRPDLVVADNFGIVRYFHQAAPEAAEAALVFDPPIELGKLRIRAVPFAADWNGDGRLDVVAGSSADDVMLFLNTANDQGESPLAAPQPIKLPGAPYGAGAPLIVTDYNNDGDPDILLQTAYGYTCWFERSFIEHGYATARVVELQQKPR